MAVMRSRGLAGPSLSSEPVRDVQVAQYEGASRKYVAHPMVWCVVGAGLVMTGGCTGRTGEMPRVNHPPVIRSVTLGPTALGTPGNVVAQVDAFDEDGEIVTLRYHWTVNGASAGDDTRPVLSLDSVKRGDQISVDVVPSDGHVEGAAMHAGPVPVGNSVPAVARVVVELDESAQPAVVKALVEGHDVDADPITYGYRWFKNDRVVQEGEGSSYRLADLAVQDRVVVEVTPSDGSGMGKPARSEAYVVGNRSPRIVSTPPGKALDGRYEYRVQAVDTDGDPLSYELEQAPRGMTIQRETGTLVWPAIHVSGGTHHIRVIATDGRGGRAYQEFDLVLETTSIPVAGT